MGEKKNALKAVLSRRFAEERIVVLDKMELEGHKTRDLKAAVGALGIEGKALFVDVDSRENENFLRASAQRPGLEAGRLAGRERLRRPGPRHRGAHQERLHARRQEPGRRVMLPQDLIRSPLITEKATRMKEASNTICFEVARSANKIEVRRAIETLFGVKVLDVRVANRQGKWKRMGRFLGQRKDWKKAYVRLAPGQTIEFFEGV